MLSAGFRLPSHHLVQEGKGKVEFWASVSEKLGVVLAPGGFPLTIDGYTVGGIGCGGAHGDVDKESAEAAANFVNS